MTEQAEKDTIIRNIYSCLCELDRAMHGLRQFAPGTELYRMAMNERNEAAFELALLDAEAHDRWGHRYIFRIDDHVMGYVDQSDEEDWLVKLEWNQHE